MLTGDLLRISARRQPGKNAVITHEGVLTYRDLDDRANRFANALRSRGLGKGDFVLAMLRNCAEYPIVHFGTARSGAVLAHVSPLAGPAELREIFAQIEPAVVIADQGLLETLRDVAGNGLFDLDTLVIVGGSTTYEGVSFDDLLQGSRDTAPNVSIDAHDPFAMTFTGGTTGVPKGALVSHDARIISAYATALEHQIRRDDIIAAVTPLYHAAGMLIWLQAAILVGATCVLFRKWDVADFEQRAQALGITSVLVVPVQLRDILSSEQFSADRYAKLRQIGCAAASLSAELKKTCIRLLPHTELIDHYGQSETGPLTVLNARQHPDKLDTVGQAAVGVEIAILDNPGQPVPAGGTGNIAARGGFLFQGYWHNPDEDALFFERRWLGLDRRSRYARQRGFLTIVGRSKEMIVSGGVNIYPREVERVLEQHPDIRECAVFGVTDEQWERRWSPASWPTRVQRSMRLPYRHTAVYSWPASNDRDTSGSHLRFRRPRPERRARTSSKSSSTSGQALGNPDEFISRILRVSAIHAPCSYHIYVVKPNPLRSTCTGKRSCISMTGLCCVMIR
ncbi:MAG: acyl--CoA ligase [Chromatiales bacterium]|nr:acyl--CoA ligase [Chromatiales bacterium]